MKDDSFRFDHGTTAKHSAKNPAELCRTARARHMVKFGDASTVLVVQDAHYCKRVVITIRAQLAHLAAEVSSASGRWRAVRLGAKGVVSGRALLGDDKQDRGTSSLSLRVSAMPTTLMHAPS